MTYRDTLHGAYRRIEDLESRLGSREAEIARLDRELLALRGARPITSLRADDGPVAPAPTLDAPVDAPDGPSLLHAIPIPITVGLVAFYLGSFGTTAPTCMDDWLPLGRASLLSGIVGGVVMALRYAALVRSGRSTMVDRLLLVVATVVALPFVGPIAIAAFHVGGILVGIVTTVVAVGCGVYAGVKWIAKGSNGDT